MMLRAYPAFTATAFASHLAYRNQVWSSVFGELVGSFAYIAVWTAGYAGLASVDGVTLPQMITYVLIAGPLLYWDTTRFIREVGDAVRTGDVTIYLLKPLHYPGLLLANQLGHYAFDLLSVFVPVAIIIALTAGLLPPAGLAHGLYFLAFWAVSWLMLFLIATITGMLAFWLLTAFALDWLLRGVMALASGYIVPLWFMPEALASALGYLPFAWVSYYPTAIYLGQIPLGDVPGLLAGGCLWLAALGAALTLLWGQARHRLVVQGG